MKKKNKKVIELKIRFFGDSEKITNVDVSKAFTTKDYDQFATLLLLEVVEMLMNKKESGNLKEI